MQDDKKIKQIQKLLDVAEGNLQSARNLLLEILGEKGAGKVDHKVAAKDLSISEEGKIIEGVFDGEQMVAPDGKQYPVPANYASKSKLVEGDTLKLTIGEDGSLIYKQIKPVDRKNIIGTLSYENGNYTVMAEGKNYKVLFASVTYYKGEPGSKASVIVPADGKGSWAALESIIHEHDKDIKEKKENQEEKKELEKTEETVKKIDLPEENKEILEEVKESYSKPKEAVQEKPEERHKKVLKPLTPTKTSEPEISDEMTVQEVSEVSAEEAKKNEEVETAAKEKIKSEHPDIKKQAQFMAEEEAELQEEKDTNSLGETPPPVTDGEKPVKELEI